MPVLVRASIEEGELQAFGSKISLPIKGSGKVYVAYLDDSIRVLQNEGGSTTVQMRSDVLNEILGTSN